MRQMIWWLWACSPPDGRARVDVYVEPLGVELDADQDGIIDGDERKIGTNPRRADTDGDSLHDGEELILGTDPVLADTDGDAIPDADELEMELDPTDPDTDAGGAWDGDELQAGTEPSDPDDDEDVALVGTFYGGGGCDVGGAGFTWILIMPIFMVRSGARVRAGISSPSGPLRGVAAARCGAAVALCSGAASAPLRSRGLGGTDTTPALTGPLCVEGIESESMSPAGVRPC
jgi:hypothetical protein